MRRSLLASSSTVAVLAVLVPATMPTAARADCVLGGSAAAAEVVCTGTFDASVIHDQSSNQLFLRDNEDEDVLDADLSGNDRILIESVSGTPAVLTVSEGSEVEDFVDRQFALFLREGDDEVRAGAGAVLVGSIVGGQGNDLYDMNGTSEFGSPSPAALEDVSFSGGAGDDTINIGADGSVGRLLGGDGVDTFNIAGEVTASGTGDLSIAISGGGGGDEINILDGALINGIVSGGGGNDAIVMEGGTIIGATVIETPGAGGIRIGFGITGDEGNDTIDVSGGNIAGFVFGGIGDDTITAAGGIIGSAADPGSISALVGYAGDDVIIVSGNAVVNGFVIGDGDFIVRPGVPGLFPGPPVPPGGDTIRIEGGTITGGVFTGGGDDTIVISDGRIGFPGVTDLPEAIRDPLSAVPGIGTDRAALGEVRGNDGNDTLTVSGGAIYGEVSGDAGDDAITVTGGTLYDNLTGGAGDDNVAMRGGTVIGDVDGGDGALDRFDFTGGVIGGAIRDFETVAITDLAVPAASDLVPDPLPLEISGNDVSVTLRDTTFAARGVTDFDLDGVGSFLANYSRFSLSGNQDVGSLFLTNGSMLDVRGRTALRGAAGEASGDLTIQDSGIDFIDGDTDDTLDVRNLSVSNATIGVDVDPNAGIADEIRVLGVFDPSGPPTTARVITLQPQNTIVVNLLAEPAGNSDTLIPIIILGDDVPGESLDETFDVIALNPNSLAGFELIGGSGGSVFLRAIPVRNDVISSDPTGITNPGTIRHNANVVQEVVTDIADGSVGFAAGSDRIQITPNLGVFSYGQFGKSFHNGVDFSSAFGGGTTSSFESNNFSIIGTAELDASAELDLEDIGLKISAFGGYTSTDVTVDDRVNGVRSTGDNDSGLFGGSVLVSKIAGEGNLNYGLVSAAGFFGSTDVFVAQTGGKGDYGTEGFVVSAKVGRNMAVADRVRFDVRGGIAYAAFYGDSFTDSAGTNYGDTRVSYGTVSFEPGISTSAVLGGFTVSPFARGLLSARFGYDNTASVNGVDFDFDDSDFTIGAQVGANAVLGKNFTAGALVEGRTSGDENSILAKLSLKYTIPR